jgi:hypothetical protein
MMKSAVVITVTCLIMGLPLAVSSIAQEASDEPAPGDTLATERMTREDLLEAQASIHGKRGRRLFKTAYWAAGLTGDMKRIYDSYGNPSSRYREWKAGVMLEKWTYLEAGRQFIFRDDRLARTRRFNPGSAIGAYLK